ncbi:MAG: hypothetical protein IT317_11670 [Anaerolineales bacterium]|nr:hypothetical protein [Anaerolineales bacterium]
MPTKLLLTLTALLLGLAGLVALFAPEVLLSPTTLTAPGNSLLPALMQLLGALYCGFAFVNFTARDSALGGIYGRPISFGNFVHFTIGALALVKVAASGGATPLVIGALVVYAALAVIFGRLLFVARGLPAKRG